MPSAPALRTFGVRPSFDHVVALSVAETRARILAAFGRNEGGFEVRSFPDFIGLHLDEANRKCWSPRLLLTLEPAEGGTTRVHGTYGPECEIWGIFLYGYLMTGLLGSFAAVLGGAQLLVGDTPWGFWVTGGMAVIAGLLYLAAQLGQKIGAWQTFQLHQAYEAAVRTGDAR